MPLSLPEAVDYVIAAAAGDDADHYQRAAGRLVGRLVIERGLTLDDIAELLKALAHLPSDPDKARVALMSWTRAGRRRARGT